MTRGEKIGYVPLPRVPHVTDDVNFGYLDFPVGFDESKLQVNVTAIHRVQQAAGLGHISIFSNGAEEESYTPNIGSMGLDGAATIGAAGHADERPTTETWIRYPTRSTALGKPEVYIVIDSAAQKRQIEEANKGRMAVRDPGPRAKVLNAAIKRGLTRASLLANADKRKLTLDAPLYGIETLAGAATLYSGGDYHDALATIAIVHGFYVAGKTFGPAIGLRKEMSFGDGLRLARHSLLLLNTLDRYALGAAAVGMQRFIKSAK